MLALEDEFEARHMLNGPPPEGTYYSVRLYTAVGLRAELSVRNSWGNVSSE